MEEKINRLLKLLHSEEMLIHNMVKCDENKDTFTFNEFKKFFKVVSKETDDKVEELLNEYKYEEIFENLAIKIDDLVDEQKDARDYATLLGMVNNANLLRLNKIIKGYSSDLFSNEYISNIYDIYLWIINNRDYSDEFKDSMRIDMVMKLVNSRALRKYFAGDYEEAKELSDAFVDFKEEDRKNMTITFSNLMENVITVANNFEMFDGIMDELSFQSRKEMFKIEFAAASEMMIKHGFIIAVPLVDYSDFTEKIIGDAYNISEDFHNRKIEDNQIKKER